VLFAFVFGLGVIQHFETQANFTVPEEWKENVVRNCGVENKINIDPETANFQKFFLCLAVFGMYAGIIFDLKYLNLGDFGNFYSTDLITTVKRMTIGYVFCIPGILPLLMSNKHSYWTVMLVRTMFPPTFCLFYQFGISKWIAIKLGYANTKILTKTDEDLLKYMRPLQKL
jgi:hypothetical protein